MRKKDNDEIGFSPFDILENLKKNNLDMPISEDEFYEMIAQVHLKEVSDYYDKLIEHVEPKE